MSRQPNIRSAYATSFTRTRKLDMTNRKPFRTAAQKAEARRMAVKVSGTFMSSAPVSYHRQAKQQVAA